MAETERIWFSVEHFSSVHMQRKVFWLLFITLGLLLDFLLPIVWGLVLTLPLALLCWWVAYRSGWFE